MLDATFGTERWVTRERSQHSAPLCAQKRCEAEHSKTFGTRPVHGEPQIPISYLRSPRICGEFSQPVSGALQ